MNFLRTSSSEILEKFSGIDPHFQRFLRDKRILQKISPEIPENFSGLGHQFHRIFGDLTKSREIPENFSGIFPAKIPENFNRMFLRMFLRNSLDFVTNFTIFCYKPIIKYLGHVSCQNDVKGIYMTTTKKILRKKVFEK